MVSHEAWHHPLLPLNQTRLEAALAHQMSWPSPEVLRTLLDADRCPENLLPWLAWTVSVDQWREEWSEAVRRQAIRNAYFIHRHKGTIGAVRRVVEPLGYLLDLVEWWQTEPPGPRGTFGMSIAVQELGITESMFLELERLIDDAKPVSRHLTSLIISLEARTNMNHAIAVYDGDELTVYPYQPERIDVQAVIPYGVREHLIDTLTVYP